MSHVYYDFAGWLRLDPQSKLQYIGNDETWKQIITAQEWVELSEDKRRYYIIEDFIAAYRDADDSEFSESRLVVE